NPGKVVAVGDEVEVMIIDIDEERRRISLGIKQCKPNPWDEFAAVQRKGDRVVGKIKSITDFGIFIGLDGDIDGLIHLSDLSWNDNGEELVRNYKKGDELEAIVLSVDPERERISLGVKQIDQDPFAQFVADNPKNSIVKGTVSEVDAKGVTVHLADGIDGYLRASEISRDRVEDARQMFKEGDEIEAKFINIDRKSRMLNLSIKAKDSDEEAEMVSDYGESTAAAPATTLGDILKEQMERN
ncbi:MAG: S1 RNA-binding domain-containing protein, partial [Pseudomonadota bacterium]